MARHLAVRVRLGMLYCQTNVTRFGICFERCMNWFWFSRHIVILVSDFFLNLRMLYFTCHMKPRKFWNQLIFGDRGKYDPWSFHEEVEQVNCQTASHGCYDLIDPNRHAERPFSNQGLMGKKYSLSRWITTWSWHLFFLDLCTVSR